MNKKSKNCNHCKPGMMGTPCVGDVCKSLCSTNGFQRANLAYLFPLWGFFCDFSISASHMIGINQFLLFHGSCTDFTFLKLLSQT